MKRIVKRSIRSFFIEEVLKIGYKNNHLKRSDLSKKLLEGEKEYFIPIVIKKKYRLEETKYKSMKTYIYKRKKNNGVILYLHGGAYTNQPLVFHWRFLQKIKRRFKAKIIVPIYPKAPFHTMEDAQNEVISLYKELLKEYQPNKIYFMGDSSGGGLSLEVSLKIKEENLPQPKLQILLSPWVDVEMNNEELLEYQNNDPMLNLEELKEIGKCFSGKWDSSDPRVSPINANLSRIAPIVMFGGTHELIVPDLRKFFNKATLDGADILYYEYEKMDHVFPLFPIPEARKAIKQIVFHLKGK